MLVGNSNIGLLGGAGGFVPNALSYPGADMLYLTTPSGMSDVAAGSISTWVRFDGGDGTNMMILQMGGVQFEKSNANILEVIIRDAALNIIYLASCGTGLTSGSTWHHVGISWDMNHGAGSKLCNVYLDGADDVVGRTDTFPASVVGNSAFSNHLAVAGSQIHQAPFLIGSLAEIYYNYNTYIDFTNSSTLQKFRSGGHPVNLGSDGSIPTGSSPTAYLHQKAASAGTNSGSCGNFNIFGSPTDASTNP